jgi:hypothetical protein
MGFPRDWRRPVTNRIDQPRDDGRGRLTSPRTGDDALNLRTDIPHGIQRQVVDRSYGGLANGSGNSVISEWPPYDGFVVIPHMTVSRAIKIPLTATAWSTKSNFDDSIFVGSAPVGNPLG